MSKIACINDISGYGRCSLTTAIAVLSVLGVQPCPVPTAVLSKHTGFPEFVFTDLTDQLGDYLRDWDSLSFDGIYSGFLGSHAQISLVEAFIRIHQRQEKPPVVVIDTVLGDAGALYATCTPQMCDAMRQLAARADVITPNITEACLLTGTVYRGESISTAEAETLLKKLLELGCGAAIITGIHREEVLCNLGMDRDGLFFDAEQRARRVFSGTGDLFASVLSGCLACGCALPDAAEIAGEFTALTAQSTLQKNTPPAEGVVFEPHLTWLHERVKGAGKAASAETTKETL